jgi:hypothetical protein
MKAVCNEGRGKRLSAKDIFLCVRLKAGVAGTVVNDIPGSI